MRGQRRAERLTLPRAALLVALIAFGLIGPLRAAAAAPAHHGNAHAHHLSALAAPAAPTSWERHADPSADVPAGSSIAAPAAGGTAAPTHAATTSHVSTLGQARGPPALIDA